MTKLKKFGVEKKVVIYSKFPKASKKMKSFSIQMNCKNQNQVILGVSQVKFLIKMQDKAS
jgi:CDP-diacylglycerol pyrophosphatase